MPNYNQPLSLSAACSGWVVRYLHHVVWRRLDPPPASQHSCFQPADLPLPSPLPARRGPAKDPSLFRRNLAEIRSYLRENLVGPVHDDLAKCCQKFVSENRLKYGDVLLYLIFIDKDSTSLVMAAKQVVYKKWKVRERMCLVRTLRQSTKLTKLGVPGVVNDALLFVIAQNCRLLEDLDISTSYISDKGVLALCGVIAKDIADEDTNVVMEDLDEEESLLNTDRKRRKAATDAIDRIEREGNKGLLRKLAFGQSVSKELEENFSLLASKMKPYFDKKNCLPGAEDLSWSPHSGKLYKFNCAGYGCPRLKRLDLTRTSYPKRSMDRRGNMVVTVGVTRDSVLTLLILLDQLRELRWLELGDILQLYQLLSHELAPDTAAELRLAHFMDISTTIEKIETAARLCPDISKIDLSMFNFSSYYESITQEMWGGHGAGPGHSAADGHWVDVLFSFKKLKDFEVVFLDDSSHFTANISQHGHKLTRICLNKMISISLASLAAVKRHCCSLQVLELHVDKVTTAPAQTLQQALQLAHPGRLPNLKSLKLGGSIYSGDLLKFFVSGCPRLQIFCFTPFTYQGDVNDEFIVDLFNEHPCLELEVFCFEKCILSEQTFFHLLEKMPKIKYIGNMGEWTMDRRARLGIKAYIKGNNVNVDIESLHYNYEFDYYF